MIKKGDLVKWWDGRLATVVSDSYTHRFMDADDHDMVAHGMGHLAGVYSGAVDTVCMETGQKRRLRLSHHNYEVVSESR